ncbi:MAG: Holliday junction resolvase RuvX [Planctomycetota bacterium]|nr:MAG: Holliday junction resolvase RuvX [Planctomycetota bacterium]
MSLRGRILAIDYGAKRTGLAVSDPLGIAAHPLPTVVSESLEETVNAIAEVVRAREVKLVLLGMPYLRSGLEGAQVDRVRLFKTALRQKLPEGMEILERDERFTTAEAESLWRKTGIPRKKAKAAFDSTAAVIILREYLEGLS